MSDAHGGPSQPSRRVAQDWSTEEDSRNSECSLQSLQFAAIGVIASVLVIWLGLFALQRSLPYVRHGDAAVGESKRVMAVSPSLFRSTDRFRIYAFGNSKMLAGFQPALFTQELGERASAFNLGIPADDRFVDLLEAALKAGNVPTHVLVQTLPTGTKPQSMRSTIQDNKKMAQILFPFRPFVRDAILFIYEAGNPLVWARQYKSNAAQIARVKADHGYYFIKSQSHFPGDQLPADFTIPRDRPNETLQRPVDVNDPEFLRLLDLAETYDFQLVVVPAVYRNGERAPPGKSYKDPVEEALRPYPRIHILGPPYLLMKPTLFSDPTHLNPTGAVQYTMEIAAMFRQLTGKRP